MYSALMQSVYTYEINIVLQFERKARLSNNTFNFMNLRFLKYTYMHV